MKMNQNKKFEKKSMDNSQSRDEIFESLQNKANRDEIKDDE